MSDSEDAFENEESTNPSRDIIEMDANLQSDDANEHELPDESGGKVDNDLLAEEVVEEITSKLRKLVNENYGVFFSSDTRLGTLKIVFLSFLPLACAMMSDMSTIKAPITNCSIKGTNTSVAVDYCVSCNGEEMLPESLYLTGEPDNSTTISGGVAIILVECTVFTFLTRSYDSAFLFAEGILIDPPPNKNYPSYGLVVATVVAMLYFAWHRVADQAELIQEISGVCSCLDIDGQTYACTLIAKSLPWDIPADTEFGANLHSQKWYPKVKQGLLALVFCFAYKGYADFVLSYCGQTLPGLALEDVIAERNYGTDLDRYISRKMSYKKFGETMKELKKDGLIPKDGDLKGIQETPGWPQIIKRLRDAASKREDLRSEPQAI